MIILHLIVFIMAVVSAIAAYKKDSTAILITSVIVAAVDIVFAFVTFVPPTVELYPTDGVVSQEGEVTLKTRWNSAIYYTLKSEEDPSIDGILYKEPIMIEKTTVLNAKSKIGPKWGPLCTWIVRVSSSGEVTGTRTDASVDGDMIIDISAEYTGDPIKVGDDLIQSNIQVKGLLADGTETKVDDFSVEQGDLSEPGIHSVRIMYELLETSCDITVIDLSSISASYIGKKLKVGDVLSNEMFKVYGIYTDGSKEVVTDFSISSDVCDEPGVYSVRIEYRGKQTMCQMEVEDTNIQPNSPKGESTAPGVQFDTYDGYISGDDDVNEYTITAKYEGTYRFDVSDMMNGFKVNIAVYAPDGTSVSESSHGLMTNEGITATLEAGITYGVKVTQYRNDGHYCLTIGQQKETSDITDIDILHDGIEYIDQQNQYTITTRYGGKYRFDLGNTYSGFKANIIVVDDHNYEKACTKYGLENNEGLSVDLEANKTYRVLVSQYRGTGTYDLLIGKQSATQIITGKSSVTGEITFTDQKNRYEFVTTMPGNYTFVLSEMYNGVKCNISVFDEYNYEIESSTYGLENGEKIKTYLEQGKKYRIVVYQYRNFGTYKLSVLRL